MNALSKIYKLMVKTPNALMDAMQAKRADEVKVIVEAHELVMAGLMTGLAEAREENESARIELEEWRDIND